MEDDCFFGAQEAHQVGGFEVEGCGGVVEGVFDVAAYVVWGTRIVLSVRGVLVSGGRERKRGVPWSRTSMMAIFEGGVGASRFEEVLERMISERAVGERRGRVAMVWVDILRMWRGVF